MTQLTPAAAIDTAPVTVASLLDGVAAAVVQSRLEAAGIDSVVIDGVLSDISWDLSWAIGGTKIQVAGADAEAARAVLAVAPEPMVDDDPWPELSRGHVLLDEALRTGLRGLIFLPLQFYSLVLLGRALLTDSGGRRGWRCVLVLFVNLPVIAGTVAAVGWWWVVVRG